MDMSANQRNEAVLVQQASRGDHAALEVLLKESDGKARAALAGRIPPRWQSLISVDDVVQQAACDAVLGLARFRYEGDGSFFAWFVTLARHNLSNAVRGLETSKRGGRAHRVATGPGDASGGADSRSLLLEELIPAFSTPSRAVARHEATDALARAIERLPAQYRQIVDLYDIQGLDAAAVAAEVGRSVGAVFMLRARAHRVLVEEMGPASRYLSGASQ